MIEKYVIPYGAKYNLKESKEGWRTIMYTHFKNTGDTYIQNICAGVKSQTDFIARRHEERIRLQQRHYVNIKLEFKLEIKSNINSLHRTKISRGEN